MRKIHLFILSSIILAACTIETSDNGDLDGYWHLETIDTLSTNGTKDLTSKSLFWAFQCDLMYLRNNYNEKEGCISHFKREGDSLYVLDAFSYDRPNGDPQITDIATLQQYGLNSLTDKFWIVSLSSSRMTLQSNTLRLRLRKL